MIVCSCCGHEFDEAEGQAACSSCVAKQSCGLVRCPQCGFESAREPGYLQRLRGWFTGAKPVQEPPAQGPLCHMTVPLTDLDEGESAEIQGFAGNANIRKFLSLGILPGLHISLLKKTPAVVIRAGYSEFAFDRDLAGALRVRRLIRS